MKIYPQDPLPPDLHYPSPDHESRHGQVSGGIQKQNLRFDRDGRPRTAYNLRHTYIRLGLMEGADIYQIAKNCHTSVEMIEKYYAAHIKTSLDAAPINVMRPKKNKRGKKAIRSTQALPQPPDGDGAD